MKNIASHISLDHLKEEEVEIILKVLERDAQIQKHEDARRQKLRDSIRFERIPEKRLSVKLRTGDWVSEITEPSRHKDKRGTDIVRASIRRKKCKKHEDTPKNIDERAATDQLHPSKPDVVIEADKLNIELAKSPVRKPSIRRKQPPKASGKQVTFSENDPEKIIFNKVVKTAENTSEAELSDKDKSSRDATLHEEVIAATVIPYEAAKQNTELQHHENSIPSETGFESYHNSFALTIGRTEEKSEIQQEEKSDKEKTTKKVRVIKRKGSSRRKPISKITDDLDRDNLFRAPEEREVKDIAENITSEITTAAVVQVATESSVTDAINPNVAEIDSATDAVSDYTVDDSLHDVENIITVVEIPTLCGAKEVHRMTAIDTATVPRSDDVQRSYEMPKEEDPSHLSLETRDTSLKPQSGNHDTHDDHAVDDHDFSKRVDISNFTRETAVKMSDDDHDSRSDDTPNILGIVQDYADVTLKPNDFFGMSRSDDNEKPLDIDEDGGRTPTIDKSQDFDGMELLKEIEAALPQVSVEAESAGNYGMDPNAEAYNASPGGLPDDNYNLNEHRDVENDEICTDDSNKPKKKKVIKIIKKSKRDKEDGKPDSPEHREDLDDQARTLIDEVSRSMTLMGEVKDDHPPAQLAGRKIVKKIVKKKKAGDATMDEHNESPKKVEDNSGQDGHNQEEFGLARRKTVRRKVSKRQPPPPSPSQ